MAGRTARRIALPRGLLAVARIVGATLAYLAVLSLAAISLYALGLSVVPEPVRGTFGLFGLGIAEAAALLIVLLVWRLVDRLPVNQLGLSTERAPPRWLRGAAVATAMMGLVVLVGYTLVDGAAWDVNPDAPRAAVALVFGLLGFLIQGPAEEVLFRGYMLENLRGQWGVLIAVVVSSLAFAVFHAANPAFGLLPFVNLTLFGAGAALYKVYVDDGRLWGVFGMHTTWNWLQQVVFGLPNSGTTAGSENVLFSVVPGSSLPDVLTGGGFGPEGTLAATLVLVALVVYSLRRARS